MIIRKFIFGFELFFIFEIIYFIAEYQNKTRKPQSKGKQMRI